MEAAMLVPSGTMGNQIAIAMHARPGTEVICEERAHVAQLEMASMAVIAGCMPRPVRAPDGIMTADLIQTALRPDLPNQTRPGLIVVENTHNLASGAATPPRHLEAIVRLAAARGIPTHMDGARLFNAATALGVEARELTPGFDSVSFCLSKGLSAPIGSLLCGKEKFVSEARRWRRRLGGGMRQAGVIAAAGIVALETMRDRLAEDHANAEALARGLESIDGLALETPETMTNIVYVRLAGPLDDNALLVERLRNEAGILCNPAGRDRVRFVTHRGIERKDIETVIDRVRAAMSAPLSHS